MPAMPCCPQPFEGCSTTSSSVRFTLLGQERQCDSSLIPVNRFPFDIIVFTMLLAHGIWQETVSLLDVM